MENKDLKVTLVDKETGFSTLIEQLGGKVIDINTDSQCYFNPFEIDKHLPREKVLSRLKTVVDIFKEVGEIVEYEFIEELANKNSFEITKEEINNIIS